MTRQGIAGLAGWWPAFRPGQASGLPLGRPATTAVAVALPRLVVAPCSVALPRLVVAPCSVALAIQGTCLAAPGGYLTIPGGAAGPGRACVRRRCRGLSFRAAALRFPVPVFGRRFPAAVLRR